MCSVSYRLVIKLLSLANKPVCFLPSKRDRETFAPSTIDLSLSYYHWLTNRSVFFQAKEIDRETCAPQMDDLSLSYYHRLTIKPICFLPSKRDRETCAPSTIKEERVRSAAQITGWLLTHVAKPICDPLRCGADEALFKLNCSQLRSEVDEVFLNETVICSWVMLMRYCLD